MPQASGRLGEAPLPDYGTRAVFCPRAVGVPTLYVTNDLLHSVLSPCGRGASPRHPPFPGHTASPTAYLTDVVASR
jgi:hypothetical protein